MRVIQMAVNVQRMYIILAVAMAIIVILKIIL